MSSIGSHVNVMVSKIVPMELTNQIAEEALERHQPLHDALQLLGMGSSYLNSNKFFKICFKDELPLRGVPPLPDALLQPGVPQLQPGVPQLHDVRLQQQQLLQGLHERLPDLLNVAQNLKLIIFGSISSMKIFMFLLMDGLSKKIGWFST